MYKEYMLNYRHTLLKLLSNRDSITKKEATKALTKILTREVNSLRPLDKANPVLVALVLTKCLLVRTRQSTSGKKASVKFTPVKRKRKTLTIK